MEKVTRNVVPPCVEEVCNKVVKSVNESDFIMTEFHPDTYKEAEIFIFNNAAEILMQHWINGEELLFTEDEADTFLKKSVIDASLYHMAKLGILDSIEDENGELVFWIKDEYKGMTPEEIKVKLDDSF